MTSEASSGASELVVAARQAHQGRDWQASYDGFARALEIAPLDVVDLDAMATAAWRLGRCKESVKLAEQVFSTLARTDPTAAASKAVELALSWLTRGDLNIGQGWMNRARRLLESQPESPTHAYLAYLDAWIADLVGDSDALTQRVSALQEMADRLDTPVVAALGLVAQALASIQQAKMTEAFRLIDEAMLPVLADEVPLEWAGDIYCLVLHHCHRVADLQRMHAWTLSMKRWCEDVAASPAYGSLCDVYRLQLHVATDDYRTLEDLLHSTSTRLEEINTFAAAEGYYQLGEIRRLRGDLDGAAGAFSRARELGCDPQPGEALLQSQRGDRESAWTALQMALAWRDRIGRMRLLPAAVNIALDRGAMAEAEEFCREMDSTAEDFGTPGFRTWAAHARGRLLAGQAEHDRALEMLHTALCGYRAQQCRHEIAEVYETMAVVHTAQGQHQLAAGDTAAAASIYRQLGVDRDQPRRPPGRLTEREVDILTRIAGGATNQQVAEEVFLSEKTVRRHLANIFTKLGVSSRTAAVAWAYANKVVEPRAPSP
ncbi:helix-turn-helix transcriptional regulator [Mycobacteriaceae bacterium 1482268.1]|nr:helix-turn-helix transcriptional regulator [Mycobacteriaceae bacterium 1482268.1]